MVLVTGSNPVAASYSNTNQSPSIASFNTVYPLISITFPWAYTLTEDSRYHVVIERSVVNRETRLEAIHTRRHLLSLC